MRTTLLVIHILAAGAWLGANAVQIATNPRIRSFPTDAAAWWMRQVVGFGPKLYGPASGTLLITGILLVLDGPFEFSSGFVSLGFVMVVVGAVLGTAVFGPRGRALADALEAGDDLEVTRLSKSMTTFGMFDSALLVVTVVAMVGRWGV